MPASAPPCVLGKKRACESWKHSVSTSPVTKYRSWSSRSPVIRNHFQLVRKAHNYLHPPRVVTHDQIEHGCPNLRPESIGGNVAAQLVQLAGGDDATINMHFSIVGGNQCAYGASSHTSRAGCYRLLTFGVRDA